MFQAVLVMIWKVFYRTMLQNKAKQKLPFVLGMGLKPSETSDEKLDQLLNVLVY